MLINCVSTLTDLAVLGVLTASGFNKKVTSLSARKAVFYSSPPLAFFRFRIKVFIHGLEGDEREHMDFSSPPRRANTDQSKGERQVTQSRA